MKRPDKNELIPKNNWQGLRKLHNKNSYIKAMEQYADYLEAQIKSLKSTSNCNCSKCTGLPDLESCYEED